MKLLLLTNKYINKTSIILKKLYQNIYYKKNTINYAIQTIKNLIKTKLNKKF